jgi:hypothetical protein
MANRATEMKGPAAFETGHKNQDFYIEKDLRAVEARCLKEKHG